MSNIIKTLLALLIGALPLLAQTETTASLRKISDGDTMIFHNSKGEFKCRLYGIDTPEKFKTAKFYKDMNNLEVSENELESAGEASTDYAKQRLHINSRYDLTIYGSDKYGRNLCVIYLSKGKSFNEKIIEDGYAVVYKRGKYTEDKELRHTLNQAQGRAVRNEAGLWRNHKQLMNGMAEN